MNYLKSNQFSQELGTNSIPDQYLTLEKQLDQFNLSSITTLFSGVSNQIKTRAYEFAAIFEDAFDRINIIQGPNFNHLLMQFFRVSILDCDTQVDNTSSKELLELKNRLKLSQEKISKLSFIKKHFHIEKSLIDSTRAQLMEEKFRLKIAIRYCNDWKQNHISQWIQMLLQTEQDLINTIHRYELNLQQSKIAHEETIRTLTEQTNQMKIDSNKCYEHYQDETMRFEKELTDFRYEFNQIKRQRQEMFDEYQRMKIIVEEYNQMKQNERLTFERQKQEEEAIRRIQAWWRGTMSRHVKRKKRKHRK